MRPSAFGSLRSRAVFLVLLAILPLLALTIFSYIKDRERTLHEVQKDALVATRNLATVQEMLIQDTRQLLVGLAKQSVVQRGDRAGCNALFAKLLKDTPHCALIGAADAEGRMFASAPPAPKPVKVADRRWFQEAVRTRAFFVAEPILGRISGKYSLSMSYPILDASARVQGVVVAAVDLDWLGNLLAKSNLPPGTAVGLTDATRTMLFRYPEPLEYIGKKFPEALIRAMQSHAEGVAEGVGLPGDERLFAFARLVPPWQHMWVAIGLPEAQVLAQVNHDLKRNLIWLGLVALLAVAAAWGGSGWAILRPVKKLRRVTERLAQGDLSARAGPDYAVGELGLLGHAFDQMADSLEERDARLKRASRELNHRLEELKEGKAKLEEANRELESFSYSVSHDLRAPLRGIAGFARILKDEYAPRLDDEGRRFLEIIQSETKKMGKLIDDLLAFSRLGRKVMRVTDFDMENLARAAFADLCKLEAGRNLKIHFRPMPPARGDRDMLRQVLMNLLGNAIKFTRTREGAEIEVSGRSTETENIYCVKDNGVGFDMAYVEKLFGVFQRLHSEQEFEGTGVGLANVQRVVQRHGGRVWAEGQVGAGAVFCFSLPREGPADISSS
jgi:signal transduction histidine kinase